jgi:wobble nucleotide-excising tRNase
MINRIKQIQNLDAFDSLDWAAEDLKRYNLIYGWNASGKTTISRLFSFLEKKEIYLPEYQSVEFNVQTDIGLLKRQDLKTHNLNVRVFNEDFIRENIQFSDSKAKQIIIIGKENLELQKEIEILEKERKAKQEEYNKLIAKRPRVPKYEQILTDAASEVTKQFGNTPLANDTYYGRSYRKNKVEDQLNRGLINEQNIDSLIIPDSDRISEKREIIKKEKEIITIDLAELQDLKPLFASANAVLRLGLKVEEIEELNRDKELRDWTETGYHIHKERKLNTCQFCQNPIPKELFDKLGNYFTVELQEAQNRIDDNINKLKKIEKDEIGIDLDSSKLFPDISKDYLKAKNTLETQGKRIKGAASELIKSLEKKRDSLQIKDESIVSVEYPEKQIQGFNEAAGTIKALILKHNERVGRNLEEVITAAKDIELHTIATILKGKDYFYQKKEYEEQEDNIKKIEEKLEELSRDIKNKWGAMKNTSLAVEKINTIAKEYFGKGQIYLEIMVSASGNNGYVLKRRTKIAKHLSEGERSILALIYFFVKLEEEGCDKSSCTVIIDDPVDSQDAIFLFRTYGLLKRQLKDTRQLIIFTHNYEFFNLLRDWFISKEHKDQSQLCFISINKANEKQQLRIEDLPDLLKDYKSEYEYLFSQLYLYANDKKLLDEPLVANIARKVLEYFASFKWICKTSEEFTSIVLNRFVEDTNQLKRGVGDFVVKFVHEYSHGQDFSRPVTAAMLEAKNIAKNTLEFIKLADKEHYDKLEAKCDTAQ